VEPETPYPRLLDDDSYDRAAWRRSLERLPALGAVIEAGQRLHPGFAALGQDVFTALFKYTYRERAQPSAQGRTELARQVVGWVRGGRDFETLRAETVLEEDRAAYGAWLVLQQVARALRQEAFFSPEELLEHFALDEAERHAEALEEQRQAAEELAGDAQDPELAQRLEGARRGIEEEAREQGRQIQALRQSQQRRLEALPASVQSQLRDLTGALPQRIEQSERALEDFGQQVGAEHGEQGAARLAMGDRLLRVEKLRKLARLVGALRAFARGVRRDRFERTPTEVHAIGQGRDLSRLLPSEAAALRDPRRRALFLRRYLEGELMQYALQGQDKGARGPLVVCLDGSGSMAGDKELWAKGVGLTLMEIARQQRRHFRAVVFSGHQADLRVFDLLQMPGAGQLQAPPVEMEALLEMAEYFPRGGTNFQQPLQRALELLQEKDLKRGDVVLITDGQAQVHPKWLEHFKEEQRRLGFQVYGVMVDTSPGGHSLEVLRQICDRITSVKHLTLEDARDIFLAV
jgi:uncharacterized protein with von Willebrand factor type A (vWA) domain